MKREPEINIYVNPIDPLDPTMQRAVKQAMDFAEERYRQPNPPPVGPSPVSDPGYEIGFGWPKEWRLSMREVAIGIVGFVLGSALGLAFT